MHIIIPPIKLQPLTDFAGHGGRRAAHVGKRARIAIAAFVQSGGGGGGGPDGVFAVKRPVADEARIHRQVIGRDADSRRRGGAG